MSKVKVSKEVATALDTALKVMDKEKFFEEHSNKFRWTLDIYLPLNQISNWQMSQILINGYEVEKTPEEKLISVYNHQTENKFHDNAFNNGVIATLEILNIKIKGIND